MTKGFKRNGKFHPIRERNSGISEKMMQLADPEKNGTIVVGRKYGIRAEIGTPLIGKIAVEYQKDVVSVE